MPMTGGISQYTVRGKGLPNSPVEAADLFNVAEQVVHLLMGDGKVGFADEMMEVTLQQTDGAQNKLMRDFPVCNGEVDSSNDGI